MCKLKNNMSNAESIFRFYIAIFFMVLAVSYSNYLFLIFPIILIYTAIKKRCFLYGVLGINKNMISENKYKSLLPLHNESPVYIFDSNGEILFKNIIADEEFKNVNNISDLEIDLEKENRTSHDDKKIIYDFVHEYNNKYYKINVQNLLDEEYTLAYFTDITEVQILNDEIEKTQSEIIYVMGEIGESRSKETGNHVKRVAHYSKILALHYGLDEEEAEILKMASPMHDIGKVGIPDAILNKPGRHTKGEFEIMKTHAQLGYSMLNSSDKPIIKTAAIVSLEHHEKYDGSGYPKGLKGKEIHIYGRITAIADVFDALGSARVYKKAWELDDILTLFKEEKGKHFDPELIDIFFNNMDEFLKVRDSFKDVE